MFLVMFLVMFIFGGCVTASTCRMKNIQRYEAMATAAKSKKDVGGKKERPRKWTKTEKVFVFLSFLACAADFDSTRKAQEAGLQEANTMLYGENASDSEMIIYMGLSQGATILFTHYVPKLRKVLLGFNTVVHGGAAYHNYRLTDKHIEEK